MCLTVGMISQVEDRRLVCGGLKLDDEIIAIRQLIHHCSLRYTEAINTHAI